jgi:septal ring factor EnvC (AmiA/AmiB activator)
MRRATLALALALALAAGWSAAWPAAAQDTDTVLAARRAAQALAQAALALQEARGARDRVEALTGTVRAYEDGLTALREGLRQAAIRERDLALRLEAKREEIARLVGLLAAVEQSPGPLLMLHPSGPLGTARSAMLVAEMTPALQAEAEALRLELEEAARLRSLREGAAATLAGGLSGAQAARLALSQAIAERAPLPRRTADDPEALAAILAGADTLEAYAAALAAVPLAAAAGGEPPFRALRGRLPLPVAATVLRGFGARDAAGVARPGLILASRPLALVTAPAAATVRYAGPLPDYGNVIILEPAAGYLVVLAGLGRTYAAQNEVVAAGAPLGLMGGRAPEPGEVLDAAQQGAGGDRSETLYMELREGGVPVDPGGWFALQRG